MYYVDIVEKGPGRRFASGSSELGVGGLGGKAPNLTKVIHWALDEVVNFVMPRSIITISVVLVSSFHLCFVISKVHF